MCCIALLRCVLVSRCGSAGVEWYPYAGWSTSKSTISRKLLEMDELKSTISRKLLKMDVLTFETCWAVNSEIIKQVTRSWSIFIQLSSISLFSAVRYMKDHSKVSKSHPFILLVRATSHMTRTTERWWRDADAGKLTYSDRNLSQCHFAPPDASHGLTWDGTRRSEMRSKRLATWATSRLQILTLTWLVYKDPVRTAQ